MPNPGILFSSPRNPPSLPNQTRGAIKARDSHCMHICIFVQWWGSVRDKKALSGNHLFRCSTTQNTLLIFYPEYSTVFETVVFSIIIPPSILPPHFLPPFICVDKSAILRLLIYGTFVRRMGWPNVTSVHISRN